MKFQKTFTFALSCLLVLETPFTAMAASVPETPAAMSSVRHEISSVETIRKADPAVHLNYTTSSAAIGDKLQPSSSFKAGSKKSSVKLKRKSLTLYTENTYKLKVSAKPSSDKVRWTSSDPKVAKVDASGTITGMKAGSATITSSIPGAKDSCQVTVLKDEHKLNRSSQILMEGSSATLVLGHVSSSDSVSFTLEDPSSNVVKISPSGNRCKITAKRSGTATVKAVCSRTVKDQTVTSTRFCKITVLHNGIRQQQLALAVNCQKALKLENAEKPNTQITKTVWSSSHPDIASVDPRTGTVTGKKPGSTRITAAVSYSDGTSNDFTTQIKISDPKTKSSYTVLSLGKNTTIKLTGKNSFSTVKWQVKDSSLASITQDGVVTAKKTTGKTTVLIKVDGKTIKHQLIITNPRLTSSYATLAVGKKMSVPVKGASSKSKITCKSKKNSVAKIDKSGKIVGRAPGNAEIIVTVDGTPLKLQVTVAAKGALNACKRGYKLINSSRYSQARRMSRGYYDCSSLVFRSYNCNSGLLGGTPSWAPTAASMAAYLERTGKVISYRGINSSKLVPGDLIFYRKPRGSNGRYKNIYHVSMYYGSGYRLEKPLRVYGKERNIVMIARPLKK
ncbi:MAG: hypothetical protein HFH41_07005 [Lachnospiraceae bacterium]|nr:hypothetical protein [Lachnospiraceae bacterium]